MSVEVTVDRDRLDVDLIHRWLSTDSYWALGRSRELVERAIDGSLNFGLFTDGELVGYARVVTDRATFAWLCDVYVDRSARGRGLGVHLVEKVLDLLRPMGLKRVLLITGDAHELYRKAGFAELSRAGDWMVLPASSG